MQFQFELLLNAPREEVWAAFDNPDNLARWQPTLRSFEHQTGEPGSPGATSKLVYEENGRLIEMTETVDSRKEGEELSGRYVSDHGTNRVRNRFESVGANQTRWLMDAEFELGGMLMWLMSPMIRGVIRKRLEGDMNRFKQLLEAGELPPH